MPPIENLIGTAATNIAKDIKADAIVSIEKIIKEEYDESNEIDIKVSVFKRVKKGVFKKTEYNTTSRKLEPGSIIPIKEILIGAINKKYINKGEKIVCVEDGSLGSGYKGVLFIFDVDEVFFKISQHKLSEKIGSEVIESIINLATELGREGREGRHIGTAFIISEHSEISKYLRQLIINPFSNTESKITDPEIKETVKEFSQLDGAFIIDPEGKIISSGTYIDIDTNEIELHHGFGTRHRACAAITKETDAIAIAVSSSGGRVRIFKEGKIVMKI
jgi:DNA integrity scanning protein DisA with diadenylate cyclase activity